jgi:hypothetical protein
LVVRQRMESDIAARTVILKRLRVGLATSVALNVFLLVALAYLGWRSSESHVQWYGPSWVERDGVRIQPRLKAKQVVATAERFARDVGINMDSRRPAVSLLDLAGEIVWVVYFEPTRYPAPTVSVSVEVVDRTGQARSGPRGM